MRKKPRQLGFYVSSLKVTCYSRHNLRMRKNVRNSQTEKGSNLLTQKIAIKPSQFIRLAAPTSSPTWDIVPGNDNVYIFVSAKPKPVTLRSQNRQTSQGDVRIKRNRNCATKARSSIIRKTSLNITIDQPRQLNYQVAFTFGIEKI